LGLIDATSLVAGLDVFGFIVTLLWLVISVLLLGFNHLVSDWLDYRRCRIVTVN
jgi:hypothetical protein